MVLLQLQTCLTRAVYAGNDSAVIGAIYDSFIACVSGVRLVLVLTVASLGLSTNYVTIEWTPYLTGLLLHITRGNKGGRG